MSIDFGDTSILFLTWQEGFIGILVVAVVALLVFLVVVMAFFRPLRTDREIRDDRYPRPLDRPRDGAISGVCGGFARYFGWDPGTTRMAVVVFALLSGVWTVVLAYLLLWRLMPLEPMPGTREAPVLGFVSD